MMNHWVFNSLPSNDPINLGHIITLKREEESALGDRTYSIKFQGNSDGLRLVWNFPNQDLRDSSWMDLMEELKRKERRNYAAAPEPQPKQPAKRKSRKRKVEA